MNNKDSQVFNVIRGINTLFPIFSPVIFSASILYLYNFVTFKHCYILTLLRYMNHQLY